MSLYYDGPRISVPQFYYEGYDDSDYEPYECGEMTARRNEAYREARMEANMLEQEQIEIRKAYGYLCQSNVPVCVRGPVWVEFCDGLPF